MIYTPAEVMVMPASVLAKLKWKWYLKLKNGLIWPHVTKLWRTAKRGACHLKWHVVTTAPPNFTILRPSIRVNILALRKLTALVTCAVSSYSYEIRTSRIFENPTIVCLFDAFLLTLWNRKLPQFQKAVKS